MTTALLRGCDDFPDLIGRQEPEWALRSEGADFLHGRRCVEFFEWGAKTRTYPWQVDEIMQANALGEDGRWTHKDQCVICPRQNGKSFFVEAIILYRLFVLGHQIVFTAQRWPTAQSIRNRLWRRIKSNKKLTAKIKRNVNSQGMAEIELESGAKVQFSTRSADSGRGFDKIDLVIFDEAYNLEDADIDAMLPIQLKADDPQTIYLSTPVNRETHSFGEKLSELRRMAHDNRPAKWAWSEYAAPEGADRATVETWALANPSLRDGPEVEAIRKLYNSMSETSFDVEILGRGLWFEPVVEELDEFQPIFSDEKLAQVITEASVELSHTVLAVDASPDRSWCSIAAAGRAGTKVHGLVGYHGGLAVDAVVGAVLDAVNASDPVAILIDPKSPAEVLIDPIERAGFEVVRLGWADVKSATSALLAGVDSERYSFGSGRVLREAIEVATLREDREGGVALSRQSGVICQLVAVAAAMWGVDKFAPLPKKSRFTPPPATVDIESPVGEIKF